MFKVLLLAKVEGMEVGLTLGLENREGSMKLSAKDCGCYVEDISIKLDGGASWLYQGVVDAFEEQIGSAVESTITKKLKEGIIKLDSFLQALPKEIPVDNIASLNVTFVNDPLLSNSSIGFDINGLFTRANATTLPKYYQIQDIQFLAQTHLKCLEFHWTRLFLTLHLPYISM
ncbi:putative BPI/LBP family protein [Vitis vinifera]|uniref:Putative BPI/LBP family protein n=1 Tax=Vitis vinifera TaxID=29760 RepID=A0A438BQV5_VITVI|nr:putative BPI/LBP family protein [Vitis vinifera]